LNELKIFTVYDTPAIFGFRKGSTDSIEFFGEINSKNLGEFLEEHKL
jgi:hypothetical protein